MRILKVRPYHYINMLRWHNFTAHFSACLPRLFAGICVNFPFLSKITPASGSRSILGHQKSTTMMVLEQRCIPETNNYQ